MAIRRGPYQGVANIIRFNWHFYAIIGFLFLFLGILMPYLSPFLQIISKILIIGLAATVIISLTISYYIYDYSGLYDLDWLPTTTPDRILNVNAGFDETSALLQERYPQATLTICDFYDPQTHTEVSIKRARKAYPPFAGTLAVSTDHLPFAAQSFDLVLALLSAHEIRDEAERVSFFRELGRVCTAGGQIKVTEHLRDINNLLAYNIGFFHFYSRSSWLKTFEKAGLQVIKEQKHTQFIHTFTLQANGNSI